MRPQIAILASALTLAPAIVSANEYSTVARVQYVQECMTSNADLNIYEGTHKCSCVIDEIAKHYTESEYDDMATMYKYKNIPADRGRTVRALRDVNRELSAFEYKLSEAYKFCRLPVAE